MEFGFAGQATRDLCEREKLARQRLGVAAAKKLRRRLEDLASASHLGDIIAGKPHPLSYGRKGSFSISLGDGLSLILRPSGDDVPLDHEGDIDWPRVQRVTIMEITDYHD